MSKQQKRWMMLAGIILIVILYFFFPPFRGFVQRAVSIISEGETEQLQLFIQSYGVFGPLISTFLMILAVIVAPIPTFIITFTNGLSYGVLLGGLLSWGSALIGAAVCYYLAHYFGRPLVVKLVPRRPLDWADTFFQKYGMYAVILSRVVPVVSYGAASYAAGLTKIKIFPYMVGTAIGQTPGTFLFSYIGAHSTNSYMFIFWLFSAIIVFGVLAGITKNIISQQNMRKK
ncbi:TVP38/TMEM64 family protein [Alkalicoccus saliphilus]|nr:TVP38/TMEM64 family protein [Alkalicoccus saliphilus]